MASHYTCESKTTPHDIGGVMGRQPLKTFFWVLTILQSRLLARVQSGLYKHHDSFLTHAFV